jgi:hypothetical protein
MKEIKLSQGYTALVDDEDYERVSMFMWSANVTPYTVYGQRFSHDKKTSVMLHRFIMDAPKGKDVAHLDNNGLNCQRYNMRITTRKLNSAGSPRRKGNKTGYRGVFKDHNRWVASIRGLDGKKMAIGRFNTAEEAAKAYNDHAKAYHGEFAILNELPE